MGIKCPLKTIAFAVDEKKRQSKVVGVELRAGGGLHGPEKPGWSAGDMVNEPGNEMKNNNKMKIKNEIRNNNKMTTNIPKAS